MCADLALFDLHTLAFAGGAVHDPVGALLLCASPQAASYHLWIHRVRAMRKYFTKRKYFLIYTFYQFIYLFIYFYFLFFYFFCLFIFIEEIFLIYHLIIFIEF